MSGTRVQALRELAADVKPTPGDAYLLFLPLHPADMAAPGVWEIGIWRLDCLAFEVPYGYIRQREQVQVFVLPAQPGGEGG